MTVFAHTLLFTIITDNSQLIKYNFQIKGNFFHLPFDEREQYGFVGVLHTQSEVISRKSEVPNKLYP